MFEDDKTPKPTEPKDQQSDMQKDSKPSEKEDKDEFKFNDWASI
ncbi:MAG: hypothetical protein ACR2O1_08970 [Boseongicola sp.]